jgi:hypothetical protein
MNSEHNKDAKTEHSTVRSRRVLLQKASVGVVIASIPAKSVWATGSGGILNSIVASTHASGWTGGSMALLSFGCWKNKFATYSQGFNFVKEFGGNPYKGGTPVSSFEYKEGKNTKTIDSVDATFWHVMKATGSMLDRTNSQICAMYLNAYYGGSLNSSALGDLNFPVVNNVTGRPFGSFTQFADWLYDKADKPSFGNQLSDLIKANHSAQCTFSK